MTLKQNKVLHLIRHAKSSWENPTLADLDRPLNNRGIKDAPTMGKRLRDKSVNPGLVITSPANRAHKTAVLLSAELGFPLAEITVIDLIYGASVPELVAVIRDLGNSHNEVILIGHNPEITRLVNHLVNYSTDNLPTCGIATLEFATDNWNNVENVAIKLIAYDFPKKIQT